MKVSEIKYQSKKCYLYEITYKDINYVIGDSSLNKIIGETIDNFTYTTDFVKMDNGEEKLIKDLDEKIIAFLSEPMNNPTEEEIISEIHSIIDETIENKLTIK